MNPSDLVTDVFQKAKEHGAEAVDVSGAPDGSGAQGSAAFHGGGYRLGDSVHPAHPIPVGATGGGGGGGGRRPTVAVVLRMWENGFSLDDGPLRSYDEQRNMDFIDSIRAG